MSFSDGPVDSSGSRSGDSESEELSVEEIVENTRMTDKHKAFLRCVYDYDGRVTISKLKDKTGLSQDEANSRFRKWSNEKFNLIEVEKLSPEESGKPTGERVAVLNDRGERAIQRGLIGDVFNEEEREVRRVFGEEDVEDFEDLKDEVERLGNVVSRMQSELDSTEDDAGAVDEKVNDLEDTIIRMSDKVQSVENRVDRVEGDHGLDELDGVESRVSVVEKRVESVEDEVSSLRDAFDEFRETVRSHLLNAEAYMKGIRWALEEGDADLSVGEYIGRVRESQEDADESGPS